MPYTFREAIKTAYEYLDIDESKVTKIENTNDRGIIYEFDDVKTVIFIYPISCKKGNKQNFFDTRDSGVKERGVAWNYAKNNNLRYFCLGFNEEQERYKDYVLSLESNENAISNISFRKASNSENTGTQVNIPNDFIPNGKFSRIHTKKGFYISAIKKEYIQEYIRFFDNRPYMNEMIDENNEKVFLSTNINKPYQRIFFGAPGTGKSYELNKEANKYFGEDYERVTFHPNYTYGSFVGAYKPFPKVLKNSDGSIKTDQDGNIQETITYEYIPGILMKQLVKAFKNPNKNYLLLIEEINRANVASVFGDIFQLLDRNENGESEYFIATSKELQEYLVKEFEDIKLSEDVSNKLGKDFSKLYLPNNLYIWATMNSADQGVMPMDTAFRRRWEFRYLGINEIADANKQDFDNYKFKINSTEIVKWDEFRRELNKKLSSLNIPEDKLIGPYFISKSILESTDLERLTETIKNKVLMYLYEDAAKAFRSSLFAEGKYSTYSSLCKYFDDNALSLFKGNIEIETELIDQNSQINEEENLKSEE